MFKHSISSFEQDVVTIHPGEYYATPDDAVISTVLGSCVAVGLFDTEAGAGGLNHFMLARDYRGTGLIRSPDARYGMYAMELLVNELLKIGARRAALRAKVFGGGSVLRFADGSGTRIPGGNIEFAFDYLGKEGIPVIASDVGGKEPRKIFFFARTGKVLLKRIPGSLVRLAKKEESRYLETLRKREPEGPIVLF